jgi:DNA-nicking Smr family endonuclease
MAKKSKTISKAENPRPSKATPRDDFLTKAFADVAPLPDRDRLAPRPKPKFRLPPRRQAVGLADVSGPAPRFVLERDDDHVSGYRADLGPGVLAVLRSSRWKPQDTLDLHGYRTREMEAELVPELLRLVNRGISRLLIVHGKGLHSEGGIGVLGLAVIDTLTGGRAGSLVRALKTAPLRLGGSGALAVELEVPRELRSGFRGGR